MAPRQFFNTRYWVTAGIAGSCRLRGIAKTEVRPLPPEKGWIQLKRQREYAARSRAERSPRLSLIQLSASRTRPGIAAASGVLAVLNIDSLQSVTVVSRAGVDALDGELLQLHDVRWVRAPAA